MSSELLIYAGSLIISGGLLVLGVVFAKYASQIEESYAIDEVDY